MQYRNQDYLITRNEDGSVIMSERFYLEIAREARAKAEEEFQRRAGEQWKKNQIAIREHRDYNLSNFVVTD